MSAKTKAAYIRLQHAIGAEGDRLNPSEWEELLDELAGHISALQECLKEENQE